MPNQIYTSALIGKKESVVDEFLLLNHYFIPLLSMLGFSQEIGNVQHEWFEDTMFAKSGIINNSGAVGEDDTTITVADGSVYRVGHVVQATGSDELMLITAISTHVLTVTREYQDTTKAAIDDGTALNVLWIDGEEGADARAARYKPRTRVFNYTQIFDESIEITGTAEAILQYGVDSEYEKEKQKKLEELAWQLENALINGHRWTNSAAKTKMGGLRNFIATNVTDGGAADVTEDMLNSIVQDVWAVGGFKGGGAYIFKMSPTQKRMCSKLNDGDIVVPHMDTIRGATVDAIRTDLGTFPIVVNNNLRSDEIIFTDLNRMAVRPLRGRNWFHTFMGKTGDKTVGQIVGEFTLEFMQEKAHSRLFNLDVN